MVRAVVGTLVEVGRGKMTVDEFRKVIEDKDRCSAGSSVPGHALFLVDVGYPEELFIVSPSDISISDRHILPVFSGIPTFFDANGLEICFPKFLKQFLIIVHQCFI